MIESLKNLKIKNLLLLGTKKKKREVENCFIVEGVQENYWAIKGNYSPKEFFVYPDFFQNQIRLPSNAIINYISKSVFEKIAYRKTSGGIVGIYEKEKNNFKNLHFKNKNALIIIIDQLEKPGNLGAILRSAEASGVDAVLLPDSLIDIYSPNVVRSSVGTLFLTQLVIDTSENIQRWLKEKQIISYATYLDQSSEIIYNFEYTQPTAFVFGTESTGLAENWLSFCDKKIIIPMKGKIDSLNVSNAAAICLFEANRQRNHSK